MREGGGDSARDRLTYGSDAHSQCARRHSPRRNTQVTARGDSHAARLVVVATANRGVTAPAHACMPANRHTQTPTQTSNTRGGDSVTDRPTDGGARTPSVHATAFTLAKSKGATLCRDGGTHVPLAVFNWPPPTVAELRPRTQACTHTGRRKRRRRRQTRVVATA
jgi:hypothetical protein